MAGSDAASGNNQLVLVAIPADDDPVWKFSSEKVPHLTLLYLGDNNFTAEEFDNIWGYVEHAASQLSTFWLDVVERGTLGDKNADVLFFNKKWSKDIEQFRANLLQNPLIYKAYASTDQFPQWTPHLTMGYPENPAKKIPDSGKIYSVNFDRVALWVGDSVGPTYKLKRPEYDLEVAMSQIQAGQKFLQHYGVKGMKWGVRHDTPGGGGGASSGPKPRMSEDVKQVVNSERKIDRGGTDTLSNQELQHLVNRMNLEQQYHRLTMAGTPEANAVDSGHLAVKKFLALGKTANDVHKFAKSPMGKLIGNGLKTAVFAAKVYTGGPAAAGAGLAVRVASNHFTNVGN